MGQTPCTIGLAPLDLWMYVSWLDDSSYKESTTVLVSSRCVSVSCVWALVTSGVPRMVCIMLGILNTRCESSQNYLKACLFTRCSVLMPFSLVIWYIIFHQTFQIPNHLIYWLPSTVVVVCSPSTPLTGDIQKFKLSTNRFTNHAHMLTVNNKQLMQAWRAKCAVE